MRIYVCLALMVLGAACGGGDDSTAASIDVTPASATLDHDGGSLQLAAVVHAKSGALLPTAPLSWSSSAPDVVTVDGSGLLTAANVGTATITVTSGNAHGTAAITVAKQPNPNCVAPTVPTRGAPGALPTLQAFGSFTGPGWRYHFPESIVADIDGDGDVDLVVFNYNLVSIGQPPGGELRVFRNDGHGNFTDDPAALGGTMPDVDFSRDLAAADFNHDGKIDLFAAQTGEDKQPFPGAPNLLLMAQPDGTLRDIAPTALHPYDLDGFTHGTAAGDVDCDGFADVVESNLGKGPSHLQINDGTGMSFAADDAVRLPASWEVADPRAFSSVALCDIDADGDLDLVGGGWNENFNNIPRHPDRLLINDGFGHFRDGPAMPAPWHGDAASSINIACVDVDGDGYDDLVIDMTDHYNLGHVAVWMNQHDRTFVDDTAARMPQPWDGVQGFIQRTHLGDFNGDGWPDVLVEGGMPAFDHLFVNDGSGRFVEAPMSVSFERLVAADVDGDGKSDVIAIGFEQGLSARVLRAQ